MAQTYWFFLALDYLLLDIVSFNTIENYLLDRYASPIGIYYPLYSELFSIESILLYMIIGGAALAMKANQKGSSQETSNFTGYLAILFAVLAVPAKLMTRGLIDCDTLYFAFVMFFSSLLLYCSFRNWLEIQLKLSFKEFSTVFAILIVLFWGYEPWNSPSLKLANAIKAGNISSFTALSQRYPQHLRMNSGLLNTAFARPIHEIIKTIVESGNTSISTGYMNLEIFNPAHIDILAYLQSKGVNFASMDMLRNAVHYSAVPARPRRDRIAGAVDKNYPVLRYLLQLHRAAPEEMRKRHSDNSGGSGWENLVSIAAMDGDADLMAFLIDQGFVIDEEVYQALARNKQIDKPEIKALLQKSRFVSEKQDERKTATAPETLAEKAVDQTIIQTASQPASPANEPASRSVVQPFTEPAKEPLPEPGIKPVSEPLTETVIERAIQPGAEPGVEHPANLQPQASLAVSLPDSLQLRLESDGLDLILTSGADVKRYRENQQNIFHYLAENWHARDPRNQHDNVDFAGVFREAQKRKIDLDKKDKGGLTPLWSALQANNFRAFIRLLEAGADRSARNAEGATMIEFCSKNDRKILLSLLSEVSQHEK